MSDEWGGYRARLGEEAAWIEVDMDAHHDAPEQGRPTLLRAWVALDAVARDGAAEQPEFSAAIVGAHTRVRQGELFELLANQCGARPVGSATTAGRHTMFFYLPGSEGLPGPEGVDDVLRSMLVPSEDGANGFEWSEDPDWRTYIEVLFPTQRELLGIASARVRASLQDEGDDLGIPRPVSHVALLPDAASCDELRLELEERGFVVTAVEGADEDLPFGLEFERVDAVHAAGFDRVLDELFGLVGDREGEYEGWETNVAER